jgi:hypothetical protein
MTAESPFCIQGRIDRVVGREAGVDFCVFFYRSRGSAAFVGMMRR